MRFVSEITYWSDWRPAASLGPALNRLHRMRSMFRKTFFTSVFALALAVGLGAFAAAQTPATTVNIVGAQAIGPITTTVSDMDRSLRFYTEVLSFEKVSDFSVSGKAYEQLFGVSNATARIPRI